MLCPNVKKTTFNVGIVFEGGECLADIKTKDRIKGTIKSIDRASVATDKMKHAYARTKEVTNSNEQSSPSSFAENQMSSAGQKSFEKSVDVSKKIADSGREQAIHYIKTRKLRQQVSNIQANKAVNRNKEVIINSVKNLANSQQIKRQREANRLMQRKQARRLAKKRSINRITNKNAVRKTKNKTCLGKRAVSASTSKAIKMVISGTRALVATISAGGMVALVIVIICTMFGAAFYFSRDEQTDSYQALSA